MEFQAVVVEAYLGEFDIHTVHFDDGQDRYLQLRTPEQPHDPRDLEPGYGLVEVEVNNQLDGGVNCFEAAELFRGRFRLVLARDDRLVRRFGELVVTFDLDKEAFTALRRGLERGSATTRASVFNDDRLVLRSGCLE
jgi:hypothetical protein